MSSRHLLFLVVVVLSSLLLNSQESSPNRRMRLPQCGKDVPESEVPKCNGQGVQRTIVISCAIGAGDKDDKSVAKAEEKTARDSDDKKVMPHAIPTVQHICKEDTVVWKLDPQLEGDQYSFLILFDQEKSPFKKQFFAKQPDRKTTLRTGRPRVKKGDEAHRYHYKVWFQNGESEDPHIIIH